ncbi:neuronal acetylcholine receptor subunit alpha-3-like [Ostrea edulis]|uniref:neuronal acetylcholine receptor subunit alpha-3-like n=1 Tax=Ostrea edulis TaxID=37623 RepID=UPI002096029E|nr:neuronal acetylcholine receptor subunit alpha-3-like [Ostrea edulis]
METIGRDLCLFLSIVVLFARLCNCDSINNLNLYNYLLDSSRYNPNVIPVCESNDRLSVQIGITMRDIVEMKEKQQLMHLEIWVRLKWIDCLLKWDPLQFQNQTDLIVPYSKIWIPDITLFEGTSVEGDLPNMVDFRADIHHTGTVMYLFPCIVTVACKMNVAYFPFDHQVCSLTFGSWIYSSKYLDLVKEGDELDISYFVAHNEWQVVESAIIKHNIYYNCCSDPFQDITFHIHIRRKPVFYVVTIILPCLLINMLTAAGFVLPSFSGEKISLQVTVFLSLTVYLLLIQDILPSSSENFPRLATYFALSMTLICLACGFSSSVLYLYYRSPKDHHISPCVRFLFLNVVRKILFIRSEQEFDNHNVTQITSFLNLRHTEIVEDGGYSINAKLSTSAKGSITKFSPEIIDNERDQNTNEWELFASVMNRLFILVYLYLIFVNCIVFFSLMMGNYDGMDIKMD